MRERLWMPILNPYIAKAVCIPDDIKLLAENRDNVLHSSVIKDALKSSFVQAKRIYPNLCIITRDM